MEENLRSEQTVSERQSMATESKFKKKRLFRVSRELNVSVDTLVDDLKAAGYKNALTGKGLNAAIVDEEAYEHLLSTYAEDRAAAARVQSKRLARLEEMEEEDAPGVVSIEDAVAEEAEEVLEEEPVAAEPPVDEQEAEPALPRPRLRGCPTSDAHRSHPPLAVHRREARDRRATKPCQDGSTSLHNQSTIVTCRSLWHPCCITRMSAYLLGWRAPSWNRRSRMPWRGRSIRPTRASSSA